jgi:hypothetical protein
MQVKCDELLAGIKRVKRAVGTVEMINIRSTPRGVWLGATSEVTARYFVPCEIKPDEEIRTSINVAQAEKLLSGRSKINVIFKEGSVTFIGARFRAEIACSEYEQPVVVPKQVKAEEAIDPLIKQAVVDYSRYLAISEQHSCEPINLLIRTVDGRLQMAAADNFHLVHIQTSLEVQDINFDMPLSYMSYFGLVDDNFSMAMDESRLYLWSDYAEVSLPAVTVREYAFEIIAGMLSEQHVAKASVDRVHFVKTLANLDGVIMKETRIPLKCQIGDSVYVYSKSNCGTMMDSITSRVDSASRSCIDLDPVTLGDVINLDSGNTLVMRLQDRGATFTVNLPEDGGKVTYFCMALDTTEESTSQEAEMNKWISRLQQRDAKRRAGGDGASKGKVA